MKNNLFIGIFLLLFSWNHAQEIRDIDYIRTHALLAVEEMHLYKIPASITLSQGILETGGGQSRLAEIANNHFGIKCKKEWTGKTISHTDDAPNECFRVYNSVQESYRDHSKFLAERPYYKNLFKLDLVDYKAWAHGLKKAGYATNPKYAGILISRIEKYNLDQFDKLTPNQVHEKLVELYGTFDFEMLSNEPKIVKIDIPSPLPTPIIKEEKEKKKISVEKRIENPAMRVKKHATKVHYITAYEGETLSQIAGYYDMNISLLASYNELPVNGKLTPGQNIFLGKKKNKGAEKFYKVKEGDTMYLISQKMGIKINRLYKLNQLEPGEEPKIGTLLNLKTKKK